MDTEILSLEQAKKEGAAKIFFESMPLFFKNLLPILKMMMPVLHITTASFLMTAPVFFLGQSNKAIIGSYAFTVIGMVYFIYYFWQFLIGMIAVSYLAKDIYERKEIKKKEEYIGYVKEFGKDYAKYWFWMALIFITIGIILFLITCLSYKIKPSMETVNTVYLIFQLICIILYPITIGLLMSYIFYAYGDKNKPVDTIKTSIKTCYTKPVELLIYSLLMLIFLALVAVPLIILFAGIAYSALILIEKIGIFVNTYHSLMAAFLIAMVLQNTLLLIETYFLSFIVTKFYFNFIKSNEE